MGINSSLNRTDYKKYSVQIYKTTRFTNVCNYRSCVFICFSYLPMFGIIIAFKEYKVSSGVSGILQVNSSAKYFIEFLRITVLGNWSNTLVISTLKLIFAFPVPILLAIMISEAGNNSFRRFIQTASYLPNFISWILVYGISTALFSESFGIVNQLLQGFGVIDKGIPFLTSRTCFGSWQWIVNMEKFGLVGDYIFSSDIWYRYKSV